MATNPQYDDTFKRIAQTLVARRSQSAQGRPSTNLDALISRAPMSPGSSQPLTPMAPREADWNLGQGFVDLLSSGTYATAGLGRKVGENIGAIAEGGGQAFGAGLDLFNPLSNLGAMRQGLADRRTWNDNLKDWDVPEGEQTGFFGMNQRDIAGLALDIALDPLWLIPGGAIAAGFKGTTQGLKLASTATKTGVALTKPSVEAARNITRSANEVRLAKGQQPVTTEQLLGGFTKEGKVVDTADPRFAEVFEGTGQSFGPFSQQGISNLIQGVKLGNTEVYSNWKTLREMSKTAKAEAKAAKAAGIISTEPVALGKNDVIAMDNLADALPRELSDVVSDVGTVPERQAAAIETAAESAAQAAEPLVKLEDVIAPATPDALTPLALRAFGQSAAKAIVDLSDRMVDATRVIYSPVAGSRLYKPEELVSIERTLDKATKAKQLGPLNPVSRAAQVELNDMARLFETGDTAGLGAALARLEPRLVSEGKVSAELSEQAGSVVREVLDTPKDITDLLEAALKAEGRPLADVPPFRATSWRAPSKGYGKPSFSEDALRKYFSEDALFNDPTNLAIAFGRTPVEKVRAYQRVGETKAQAVARKQAQLWENFRARNHDRLLAVKLQERSDWLAKNSIPQSNLYIRLEDGSMLGKGLLPDGFPAAAITVHNGRPVTTVGAVLDAVIKGGGDLSPILARWAQRNIDEARGTIAKAGVKAPRGPLSAADEDAIAERIWKQNPAVKSKADARLLAKLGPKALAQLALKPQRQFYIDAPVDRATGLPAAARKGDSEAIDIGKFIAGAGQDNSKDLFINQGRAALGAVSDAISRGEIPGDTAQAQVMSSLMRDLGIKVADSATPEQVFRQFKSQAVPRYDEIVRRLQSAAKAESMGPQLERVFAVSAAENVSIAKAVDKMDPEKVQTELRAFVDDVADAIDIACGGGGEDVLGRIIGGISG